jgi:hypothetical protein
LTTCLAPGCSVIIFIFVVKSWIRFPVSSLRHICRFSFFHAQNRYLPIEDNQNTAPVN